MKQVNSDTVEVTWLSLWTDTDWTECFEAAWIKSEGLDDIQVKEILPNDLFQTSTDLLVSVHKEDKDVFLSFVHDIP